MEGKGSTRCQVVVVEGGAWGKKRARRLLGDCIFGCEKLCGDVRGRWWKLKVLAVKEDAFHNPTQRNTLHQFAFAGF